ncbi:MAG: rhomboid family intramembrane serine protease, partial [Acidimicrobiales bacterium]
IYLLAAMGGSVFSYLFSPEHVAGLGASGAIFGIMGAYCVLARRNGWDTSSVLALIFVNLLIGVVVPGIDWRAHIGGLLAGAATALGFSYTVAAPSGRNAGAARLASLSPAGRTTVEVAVCAVVLLVLVGLLQLPPGHVNL